MASAIDCSWTCAVLSTIWNALLLQQRIRVDLQILCRYLESRSWELSRSKISQSFNLLGCSHFLETFTSVAQRYHLGVFNFVCILDFQQAQDTTFWGFRNYRWSSYVFTVLMVRTKMLGGNGLFYPIVGFASCVAFIYLSFGDLWINIHGEINLTFVERNGTQLIVDGKPFYFNGWNSYWMMDHAADESNKFRIREMLQTGARMGLTVCRTWAFNDGDYNALQISPGRFDERVFRSLDYVIAEARRYGIRLMLCLVNNLQAYGGKTQYVKWAWEEGVGLSSSNDSFFYDPSIRRYFKNYVKTVLTRKNTLTGVEYREDPTIFGWELINEPRCMTDKSGDTLQDWIEEMSTFVKSIDRKHLLTVGLEGFYGPKSPKRLTVNPEFWAADVGTDFIRNSKISTIDFASVHIYPDHWTHNPDFEYKLKFLTKWMVSHIEDGDKELKKPILFTEFGLSTENHDFSHSNRERFYKIILDVIYKSAMLNKAGAGSLVWQFLVEGMEDFNDDFGIVPWKRPSTYRLFTDQSCRLARLQGALPTQLDHLRRLCTQRDE